MLHAELSQPWEHILLESVPLLLQVAEGRTNKDAKCSAGLCHLINHPFENGAYHFMN